MLMRGFSARYRPKRRCPIAVDSADRLKFPGLDRHAEILDLEVFVDAVLRSLPAEAGFLHAAERSLGGRDQAGIDPDDPVLQGLRDPRDAAEVAGVEVRGEPEFGVVCEADRLLLGLKAKERSDRAESLFPGDLHRGRDAG